MPALGAGTPVMTTVKSLSPDGARFAFLDVELGGKVCTIVAAHALGDVADQLASIRRMFYLALPGALLIAGLGGFLKAKKSLAPRMAMAEQVEAIGGSQLYERLDVQTRTAEPGPLA